MLLNEQISTFSFVETSLLHLWSNVQFVILSNVFKREKERYREHADKNLLSLNGQSLAQIFPHYNTN